MNNYFVYIITNKRNTVLYTGITNNIDRRMAEHKAHQIEGFTKKYKLEKLVYCEEFDNPRDAITNEKRIKGWIRARKIVLIESKNPKWIDLSIS